MEKRNSKKLNFVINVLYIIAVIFVLYMAWKLMGIIRPFVMSLLLVAVLQPLIKRAQKALKIKSNAVSVIMVILLYVAVGGLFVLIVIRLAGILIDIFPAIPGYYQGSIAPALEHLITSIEGWMIEHPEMLESWQLVGDSIASELQSVVVTISQKGISFITSFLQAIPSLLINLIVTIMLSVYIGIHYDATVKLIKAQLPSRWSNAVKGTRELLKSTVFKYAKAMLIIMTITFVELCIGLGLNGVSNFIIVALGIAMLDILPVFGTGTVLVPWAVISFVTGRYPFALGIALTYITITVIRHIIEAKIVGDQLGINPIISLLSMYVGYRFFGVFGMVLSPMLANILLALHKGGKLKLYKEVVEESFGEKEAYESIIKKEADFNQAEPGASKNTNENTNEHTNDKEI